MYQVAEEMLQRMMIEQDPMVPWNLLGSLDRNVYNVLKVGLPSREVILVQLCTLEMSEPGFDRTSRL